MPHRPRPRALSVAVLSVVTAAALLAGCSGADKEDPVASSILAAATTTTTTPGPNLTKGALTGLKGTVPLTDLSASFVSDLHRVDPQLGDNLAFAAQSYDTVVVLALAAEEAKSDAPGKVASKVVDVTKTGTKCLDFTQSAAVIDDSGDPDYDGKSGAIEMLDDGDPGVASYGVMQFAKDDGLHRLGFKSAQAPDPTGTPTRPDPDFGPAADGVLTIGTLVPTTGSDSSLAAPETAGIRLAVDDINAAGGVLGRPIKLITGDSGDGTTQTATATVASELAQHVDAIIGPSSAEAANQVLSQVTGAGVILFSPAGTAQSLSDVDDRGLFFRLAPSDVMQAQVLANVISQDGLINVSVLAEDNSFGQELAAAFATDFASVGGKVVTTTNFDATSSDSAALTTAALAAKPDGVLILADSLPTAALLKSFANQGQHPSDLPMYVANISTALPQQYAGLGG